MDSFLAIIGVLTRILAPFALSILPLAGCAALAYLISKLMGFNFAITFLILLGIMGYAIISGAKKLEERKKQEALRRKKAKHMAMVKAKKAAEQKRQRMEAGKTTSIKKPDPVPEPVVLKTEENKSPFQMPSEEKNPEDLISDEDLDKIDLSEFEDPDFKI